MVRILIGGYGRTPYGTGLFRSPSKALLALSLLSLLLAIAGGLLSILHYVPEVYPKLKALGLLMQKTRATHTTFAIAWIYLASIAVVYDFLESGPAGLPRAARLRAWGHIFLWTTAGLLSVGSFAAGAFSGREYVEYPPLCSLLILAGWILYAWNFLSSVRKGFWSSPVYIFMWGVGAILFMVTYVEAHLWMLSDIFSFALKDLQVQWKSVGAMAGSFNLLVYGSGIYIAEKMNRNSSYGQSRAAFLLFGVGLLNSFTNYAHHTYHLPQSALVKWISFLVSMTEILILYRVLLDLTAPAMRHVCPRAVQAARFLRHGKAWTFANLVLAILMSIPPVNTLIHGTHVVVAHAMGTTIGIDSFILFATCSWLILGMQDPSAVSSKALIGPSLVRLLNLCLAVFLSALLVLGTSTGISRYMDLRQPEWVKFSHVGFYLSGLLLVLLLGYMAASWLWVLLASLLRARSGFPSTRNT